MKLGIFDSGLGGLLLTKTVRDKFPDLDIIYFGDTLHVPYGNRSKEAIFQYTLRAIRFLFAQDCKLIILACNTASAAALRKIQQEWLPLHYPERRILGVVVPTLEAAIESRHRKIGVLGTPYVIESGIYEVELGKMDAAISLTPVLAPLLVPLIENDGREWIQPALEKYTADIEPRTLDSLILGCTHYGLIKEEIRSVLPGTDLFAQEDYIPDKLSDYLVRHPEIEQALDKTGQTRFYVSDITESYLRAAAEIYGAPLKLEKVELHDEQIRAVS